MAIATRTSIEFVVKPKEDLYLDGSLRRLPRVVKGEAYPCQMQKNQNFSCLFRHYAKHNGLRKEDLVFSFVEELLPDQTPETVHLMPQDEIFVEHRKPNDNSSSDLPSFTTYSNHFRSLLRHGTHSDITFTLNNDVKLKAHKGILSARSEYFDAMFRIGGMKESQKEEIRIYHEAKTFHRMLEFIYTNEVKDLETCEADEAIDLLMMANEYVLQDLRIFCENRVMHAITMENIGKLLLLSSGHNASLLKDACAEFVQEHKAELVQDPVFRKEIESNAELGLLLFESCVPKNATVNTISNDENQLSGKKRRRTSNESTEGNDSELNNTPPMVLGNRFLPNTIAQSNANVQDL